MTRTVKFQIYRYDPDRDAKPYMQDLTVTLQDTDKMLLDALQRIKADVDDSLALRRSCREGVCGSDGAASAAWFASDSRSDRRHDELLQTISFDQAVFGQHHHTARKRTPANAC